MNFEHSRYSCTNCGAPVSFRAGASVFAVCTHCRTTLIRSGASLESLGMMAELPYDYSPLQIGTTGRTPQGSFALIGRITLSWEQGKWNEWYMLFDSGKAGWLAESQGWYAVSFEGEKISLDPAQLELGAEFKLGSERYTVTDIKKAVCSYSEGELPFSGALGEEYQVYDFIGKGNTFASISHVGEYWGFYTGRYYTFDELSLAQVRPLDGW